MVINKNLEIQQVKAKLYSTEHCHLCEEAEAIIHNAGIAVVNVDIVEDDNLFERYSTRIPVLHRLDNDAELDWPFDTLTVSRFLM
jgi:hypothetical protein